MTRAGVALVAEEGLQRDEPGRDHRDVRAHVEDLVGEDRRGAEQERREEPDAPACLAAEDLARDLEDQGQDRQVEAEVQRARGHDRLGTLSREVHQPRQEPVVQRVVLLQEVGVRPLAREHHPARVQRLDLVGLDLARLAAHEHQAERQEQRQPERQLGAGEPAEGFGEGHRMGSDRGVQRPGPVRAPDPFRA